MITNEEAKRFLRSYRSATVKYESLVEEFERYNTKLYSRPLTANYSGMGGSGAASDTMGENVAEFADYKKGIESDIRAYTKIKSDVRGVINRVTEVNERWGLSLHYRYIDCMSPTAVAYEMDYADSSSERKDHAKALEYVKLKWPETIRHDLELLDSMCLKEEK